MNLSKTLNDALLAQFETLSALPADVQTNIIYLHGAIASDDSIYLSQGDPLREILESMFGLTHEIWDHVQSTEYTDEVQLPKMRLEDVNGSSLVFRRYRLSDGDWLLVLGRDTVRNAFVAVRIVWSTPDGAVAEALTVPSLPSRPVLGTPVTHLHDLMVSLGARKITIPLGQRPTENVTDDIAAIQESDTIAVMRAMFYVQSNGDDPDRLEARLRTLIDNALGDGAITGYGEANLVASRVNIKFLRTP